MDYKDNKEQFKSDLFKFEVKIAFCFMTIFAIFILTGIILNSYTNDKSMSIINAAIFLFLLIIFCLLLKLNKKWILPIIIIGIETFIVIFENNISDVIITWSDNEKNTQNFIIMKEKIFVLLQMIILQSNNNFLNLFILILDLFMLFLFRLQGFSPIESEKTKTELIFFIFYGFFFFFYVLKLGLKKKIYERLVEINVHNKIYAKLFGLYFDELISQPILIIDIEKKDKPKMKGQLISTARHSKISLSSDLLENSFNKTSQDEYLFTLTKANTDAQNFFGLNSDQSFLNLLESSIIFTEKKIEQSTQSNEIKLKNMGNLRSKEKITNLKTQCIRIFESWENESSLGKKFGSIKFLDSEFKVKNKEEKNHFFINCVPYKEDAKSKILLSFMNITEKVEVERLKALDAYKDCILANVTHDLRAPLNVLTSGLECLNGKCEEKITINELIETMKINAKMMENLLQDLLDESQIKMGKIKLSLKDFNLNELFDEIEKSMQLMARQHQVSLVTKIDPSFKRLVYSDSLRLKQVIINLINNSMKFTKKNGTIKISAKIARLKKEYLCLTVEDTGIGMKQEIINQLFKPYATFEGDNGINKQGIGLGLTICQNIVSLLGPYNRIFCKSTVGIGTKFWLFIYYDQSNFINSRPCEREMNNISSQIMIDRNSLSNFLSDHNIYHNANINFYPFVSHEENLAKYSKIDLVIPEDEVENLTVPDELWKNSKNLNNNPKLSNSPDLEMLNSQTKRRLKRIVEHEHLELGLQTFIKSTQAPCKMQSNMKFSHKLRQKKIEDAEISEKRCSFSKTFETLPKNFSPELRKRIITQKKNSILMNNTKTPSNYFSRERIETSIRKKKKLYICGVLLKNNF